MRVAVLGDVGQRVYHVGDEAMTHAVVHALSTRSHTPVLLTRDLEDTRARFGPDVEARPTLEFPWAPADRERYLDEIHDLLAGDSSALPRSDQIHAFRDALASCDALVIAGGGNMNSRYGWLLHERLAALAVARSLGLPAVVTGQTVGPALSRADVAALRAGLEGVLAVGAREDATHALLTRLVPGAPVHRVLDDASFLADVPVPGSVEAATQDPPSSAGAVVVTIAAGSLGVDDAALPRVVAALDVLAASVGAPVHLVPHMAVPGTRGGDVEIHDRIAAALRAPAVSLPIEHALVAARRAREAAVVVTTRYHPAVFACEAGVPVLGIAPDEFSRVRLEGALERWGVRGAVVDLEDVETDADLLRVRLLALAERRSEVSAALAAAREGARGAAEATWDAFVAVLAAGASDDATAPFPELPEPGPVQMVAAEGAGAEERPPAVSIVVRTKDRPTMLARALDDIAAQTFARAEVIVVNDAGDREAVDDVVASAVGLEGRLRVLHRSVSTGMEAASNAGLELASAELVAIHDDDDTWHEAFLARTVRHLRDHPDELAVAVRTCIVWETTRSQEECARIEDGSGDELDEEPAGPLREVGREIFEPDLRLVTVHDLMRYNRMVPISMLLRRSALERVGNFDSSLHVVGDWEFNLRLAAIAPVTVLHEEPLAFWHQRRDATGSLANSVIASADAHRDVDLRLRDEKLRRHIEEHGDGDLMYLTRFMHERYEELTGRLVHLERQLDEIAHATRDAGVVGLARRKYWGARTRLTDRLRRRRV
ncbi:polysaccharide pyruvyl transferase family protein [Litorihabitans aurantiacus]|uniref:Glycosyltransferase n=1 Tax=Litorihabitans aurantiacus TaxID=1930061 RepID=A0AA37XFQ5_9MICO|nr:polysaccharide pyruvyl transferase family protein [Litorihabitans aurantiacus]GMA32212.1 hypothetical protein GCM10025875_22040 [Litorihabitans aurantiacus]